MDDRVLIEVVHCSHDAILEFLFGCHTDAAQEDRASLEKKPTTRLSHGAPGDRQEGEGESPLR